MWLQPLESQLLISILSPYLQALEIDMASGASSRTRTGMTPLHHRLRTLWVSHLAHVPLLTLRLSSSGKMEWTESWGKERPGRNTPQAQELTTIMPFQLLTEALNTGVTLSPMSTLSSKTRLFQGLLRLSHLIRLRSMLLSAPRMSLRRRHELTPMSDRSEGNPSLMINKSSPQVLLSNLFLGQQQLLSSKALTTTWMKMMMPTLVQLLLSLSAPSLCSFSLAWWSGDSWWWRLWAAAPALVAPRSKAVQFSSSRTASVKATTLPQEVAKQS